MFHIELRQFPHNTCRFNLTERELRTAIVDPWVRGEWVEIGERKWNPQAARLRVLEGPELAVSRLAMGRGWRNAERTSQDVTTALLAAVGQALAAAAPALGGEVGSAVRAVSGTGVTDAGAHDLRLLSDSLGLALLSQLAHEAWSLADVWRLARERNPELALSECLAIAAGAIRSLSEARLIVLDLGVHSGEQLQAVLSAVDSWVDAGSDGIRVRRCD
jgi:hypothetical protein